MKDYICEMSNKIKNDKNKIPKELGNIIISKTNELYDNAEKSNSNNLRGKIIKLVSGLCASIIVTTGIVFAQDINNYIQEIFNLNKHDYGTEQIEEAIHKNYIQFNNNDYSEDNQVKYKIENSLLNDINLIFSMDFVTDFNIDEFEDISISGLKIYDEEGSQIFIDSEDQNIWKNNIAKSFNFTKVRKSNNEIASTLTLVSNEFPKIKTLYISFDKISLYTVNKGVVNSKEIKGKYNLKFDIDNKFNDRSTEEYAFNILKNDCNINIEKIKLTNTGLGISFNQNNDNIMDYKIEILDENYNNVYAKRNDLNCDDFGYKLFAWLDIDSSFKALDKCILKITNSNNETSEFLIYKK